jgi:hypothetical protein
MLHLEGSIGAGVSRCCFDLENISFYSKFFDLLMQLTVETGQTARSFPIRWGLYSNSYGTGRVTGRLSLIHGRECSFCLSTRSKRQVM